MSSRIKSVWLDVFPYYKNSAYPLCVIFRFRRRGERLIYPDVEINFSKGVEPEWCNEVRGVQFVCSLPLEDSEQQYCDECRPYLYLLGIRRCAYKTLDMEVLLEVAKEDFNVPPCWGRRWFQPRVSCCWWAYHRKMVLSVIYGNPAYALGVLSGRAVSCQPHDFVYEHFLMGVIGQATFL